MAIRSLFPDDMIKSMGADMSLEGVASKLTYFTMQTWLIHWQTTIYAEHKNSGDVYEYLNDFKDSLMEKFMGYSAKKVKSFKFIPTVDGSNLSTILQEIKSFAKELEDFASINNYTDIENMSQELSGVAAKALYLTTLS
jgi:hypothetical protein